jgi:hypothetical protein
VSPNGVGVNVAVVDSSSGISSSGSSSSGSSSSGFLFSFIVDKNLVGDWSVPASVAINCASFNKSCTVFPASMYNAIAPTTSGADIDVPDLVE